MSAGMRLCVTMLVCLAASATSQAQYYYEFDERVPLQIDYSMFRVMFADGLDRDARDEIYASLPEVKIEIDGDPNIDGFVTVSLVESADYETARDKLTLTDGIELVEPYYLSPLGEPFVMGTRFCVGFHRDLSRKAIDDINSKYMVEFDRELYGMPNVVVS